MGIAEGKQREVVFILVHSLHLPTFQPDWEVKRWCLVYPLAPPGG